MRSSFLCILLVCLQVIFSCTAQKAEKVTPKGDLSYPPPRPESKMQVKTWDGSPDLEPGLNGSDILLYEDFEAPRYRDQWPTYWNEPVGAGTVSSPSKHVFAGKRSAYLEVPKGSHESLGEGEYVPRIPIDDMAYVRTYLRLADDFSMGSANQLKLLSIKGGAKPENAYGGAGTRPTGRDKFSVTLALDSGRNLHFYLYHPNQWGGYGDWIYCQPSLFRKAGLSRGRWYCVELMLKNSTPGKKDGEVRAWLDGIQIGKIEKLCFRHVSAVKIRRFTVENYFGGNNVSDTSPKDQRIYIDNYIVSTSPVGSLGTRR